MPAHRCERSRQGIRVHSCPHPFSLSHSKRATLRRTGFYRQSREESDSFVHFLTERERALVKGKKRPSVDLKGRKTGTCVLGLEVFVDCATYREHIFAVLRCALPHSLPSGFLIVQHTKIAFPFFSRNPPFLLIQAFFNAVRQQDAEGG